MFPMLNLMTVLIPLLLSTASAVKMGVLELNLPPAIRGAANGQTMPEENGRRLDLYVVITDKGFVIGSSAAILRNDQGEGPTIPLTNGNFDFQTLSKKLLEIKQKAIGNFMDTDEIMIAAESAVKYQTLVSTMDASRSIKMPDGQEYKLFPQVKLASGISNRQG